MKLHRINSGDLPFLFFGCVFALIGLYMVKNPEGYARHFLRRYQRDRLTPQAVSFVPTVGGLAFALGALLIVLTFFDI
jgi:uncharacterized membrane protein YfcA